MSKRYADTRRVDVDLSDRAKWILRLMYTPGPEGEPEPMFGRTRIMKAAFLVHRKMEEEFNRDIGFDFRAYKYGPFDQGVYEALEELQDRSLVEKTPSRDHSIPREEPRYGLTSAGREKGHELFDSLDPQKQELLKWVRYKQADRPLGSLLSYVYRKYPDMTNNSEITDRIA